MSLVPVLSMNESRRSPRKVVKVPKGVHREHKIPNWEGEEVEEHPVDVDEAAGREEDENRGEAENGGEEHEGNHLRLSHN